MGKRAQGEARGCFAAAGIVPVPDDEWNAYRFDKIAVHPAAGRERGGSSTWPSVSRGTGNVEVDYLNGEIVLLGRRHNVPTPVNLALQRAVNELAARGGRPGELGAQQLADSLS